MPPIAEPYLLMIDTVNRKAKHFALYSAPQRAPILTETMSRRNMLRTLCTFCAIVLVAGRSHGSSIFGITSQLQLFVSSSASQVSIRDRPHPTHGKLQSSDQRIEMTGVSAAKNEKVGDICNSDELQLVGTEGECAQPKSAISDYKIEMEVEPSYELITDYPSPIQETKKDTFIQMGTRGGLHC